MVNVGDLLAVGRTADVHAFGNDAVIKIPRPDTPSHWAEIEADLSTAVHGHGLPAPAVRDVTVVDGRTCVVFDRVSGPSMWQQMLDNPAQAGQLVAEMVAVQRMIHTSGIPHAIPDLSSRLHSKVFACSAINADERIEAERLVSGLPSGAALLHGDLHPGNVLLGPDGPMVIDWFDASIGHPIADVVRSSLLLRLGFEGGHRQSLPSATRAVLSGAHTSYLAAWEASVQLDSSVTRQWEPVLALARISEGHEETAPLLELWNGRQMLTV